MALTPSTDTSAASWIADSDGPWDRLVRFGPSGFAAYARLRFIPDPADAGQSEPAHPGGRTLPEGEQLRAALDVLVRHTRTPDDLYVCLWDGWFPAGDDGAGALLHGAEGGLRVVVPHRAYILLQGSPADLGDRAATGGLPGPHGSDLPTPAFVWPADRAWCVARDVDPHWAGIGADAPAVAELLAHPRLDVVPADPARSVPSYR